MLPKPTSGERPIALLPILVRVWDRCSRCHMQEWCEQKAGFWDSAVKGSSALRSALMANFMDETSVILGMHNATLYWDMEKFYDSVDLSKLIDS